MYHQTNLRRSVTPLPEPKPYQRTNCKQINLTAAFVYFHLFVFSFVQKFKKKEPQKYLSICMIGIWSTS